MVIERQATALKCVAISRRVKMMNSLSASQKIFPRNSVGCSA